MLNSLNSLFSDLKNSNFCRKLLTYNSEIYLGITVSEGGLDLVKSIWFFVRVGVNRWLWFQKWTRKICKRYELKGTIQNVSSYNWYFSGGIRSIGSVGANPAYQTLGTGSNLGICTFFLMVKEQITWPRCYSKTLDKKRTRVLFRDKQKLNSPWN